jgi:hypothetical protein
MFTMGDPGASAEAKDKSTGKETKQGDEASLNLAEIRELAELVNEHGFTDFEFENENIRVRLSKQVNTPVFAAPVQQAVSAPAAAPAAPAASKPVPVAVASRGGHLRLHVNPDALVALGLRDTVPGQDWELALTPRRPNPPQPLTPNRMRPSSMDADLVGGVRSTTHD